MISLHEMYLAKLKDLGQTIIYKMSYQITK